MFCDILETQNSRYEKASILYHLNNIYSTESKLNQSDQTFGKPIY